MPASKVSKASKVVVNLANNETYNVRIGEQILENLGSYLRKTPATSKLSRIFIITDENVAPLYLTQAKRSCVSAGFRVSDAVVPAGEASKSIEVAAELWQACASLNLDRASAIVALGGGVVGDLAGFVAATYMRGICLVQVPTTLLSMIDSSVGGKTAINLEAGKNLVGAFKQPAYVCADTTTLATLPAREFSCGMAELVKSALLCSDDFFFWLLDKADSLVPYCEKAPAQSLYLEAAQQSSETTQSPYLEAAQQSPEAIPTQQPPEATTHPHPKETPAQLLCEAITQAVVFKANIVARDICETAGVRACLNYGHTLGHALESLLGYGEISHGLAVAQGMRFAAHLSEEVLNMPHDLAKTQNDLLDTLGLFDFSQTELLSATSKLTAEEILEAMKHDKKARGGNLRFVLLHDVGKWELLEVEDDCVLKHLKNWLGTLVNFESEA